MPTFNDSQNIPPLLDPGDYVFKVVAFECKLSQGTKTRGSDVFELELAIEPTGKIVYERLIDHPSCNWKIDVFLKSAGIVLAKGQSFEFRKDMAESNNVPWVNPLGLRGWCRLGHKTLPASGTYPERTVNEVTVFYTDKAKLSPVPVEEPQEEYKPF